MLGSSRIQKKNQTYRGIRKKNSYSYKIDFINLTFPLALCNIFRNISCSRFDIFRSFFANNWKRQIRRSSEIAARRRIAANDQKKFTKNYIFETLKKYYIF